MLMVTYGDVESHWDECDEGLPTYLAVGGTVHC